MSGGNTDTYLNKQYPTVLQKDFIMMIITKQHNTKRWMHQWYISIFHPICGHVAVMSLLFISLLLYGCSEEITPNQSSSNTYGSEEVIFEIPCDNQLLNFGTRDDRMDATSNEVAFSNIYLIYAKEDESILHFESLTGKETSTSGKYRYYSKNFAPGKYRFYVVVNLNRYLGNNTTVTDQVNSEAQLKQLIYTFNPTQTIISGQLPMACLNTEMMRNGNKAVGGVIEIFAGDNNTITAPLSFLCAKVRYTILFDASSGGISEAFGDKRISFIVNTDDLPYAAKVGNTVSIGQEEDLTNNIVNNDFNNDPRSEYGGKKVWEKEVWDNDNQSNQDLQWPEPSLHLAEFYYCNYKFWQKIENCNPGIYNLSVQGFYRNGWIDNAWSAHNNGSEKLSANLFINDSEAPLKSLYDEDYGTDPYSGSDDSKYNQNTSGYPNGVKGAYYSFNYHNRYKGNTVSYLLPSNGDLTIGLKKNELEKGDWTCFDNFKLTYQPIVRTANVTNKQTIAIDRYEWPEGLDDTSKFFADALKTWSGDINDWYSKDRKAWQGVAYLPENLLTDINEKTSLIFPFTYGNDTKKLGEKSVVLFDRNSNADTYTDVLQRGMFYDIIIRVKTPDILNNDIILEVSVADWNYHPEEEIW